MSSANSDSFTSSFQFGCLFSCLMALAIISNTMLNKSGNSEHPCLVPHFQEKAFSFSMLGIILVVGLSYMTFMI